MPSKILSSRDIYSLVSMEEAVTIIGKAFADFSGGRYDMPVRTVTDFGPEEVSSFYKPCRLPSEETLCVKLLSQLKRSHRDDIPTISGLVILTDTATNSISAILDGGSLTAIRTGAASGAATKFLARSDASTLALFGAGTQGYTQFEAVCSVRSVKEAFICDINRDAANRLATHFSSKTNIRISVADDLSFLPKADIICTATPSSTPLFDASLLKPGVHINAVGSYKPDMQELPNDLFTRVLLYVDHEESCFGESGDLINARKQGKLNMANYRGEIGTLIASGNGGRRTNEDITVFKSVGIAAQDLAIADYIYKKACTLNYGTDFEF